MSDQAANLEVLIQIREELAGLRRTREELKGAKGEALDLGAALKQGLGIGGGMALATGAIAMLKNTLIGTVREALAFAGEMKDTSEALGISTTRLQTLRLEFEKAGVDMGRLTMAITSQNESLAAARDLSSDAAQAYRTLGLDAQKIEALPVEERMIAIARAFDSSTDKTNAFHAAAQILGSRGLPQLLNALRDLGTEGVANLERLYAKQGLIMDDETMARLDAAEKSWQKLWRGIVIGSGEAIGIVDRIAESMKKAPWETLHALVALGPQGQNPAQLAMVLAKNTTPDAPKNKATGNSPGSVGRTPGGVYDSEKIKADAATAEAAAKKILAAQDAATLAALQHAAALKQEGETIRQSVRTPAEEFAETVARLNQLQIQGAIDAETFARAIKKAGDEMGKAEDAAVDGALTRFFGPLDEESERLDKLRHKGTEFGQAMEIMWGNVADRAGQTFADILLTGKGSFAELKDVIIRSLVEIAVKMAIFNPIINGVMGMFGVQTGLPTFGTKAKMAGGGNFLTSGPTQLTVGDNPGGVELVSVLPLSGLGQSSINGQAVRMAGGGTLLAGGGMPRSGAASGPVSVSFNFTTGVAATVRAEIMAMVPDLRAMAVDAVAEAHGRNQLRLA